MDWLIDRLPDYAVDVKRAAITAGHSGMSMNAAMRRLGIRREYVPGNRRPWLVIPHTTTAYHCKYCGSRVMVGPDCDPVEDGQP